MKNPILSGLLAMTLGLSATNAAVIYLPIQYQYGGTDKYYYGGDNPTVFARAERASRVLTATAGRDTTTPFIRIYTDLLPYQPNAAVVGFTINDARNEAYASAPRYFRKADMLPPAPVVIELPVMAPHVGKGTIEIKPYVRPTPLPTTRPAQNKP